MKELDSKCLRQKTKPADTVFCIIYVEDEAGFSYNIEMQVSYDPTELRARYYHSQMDMELLLSGHDYDELLDSTRDLNGKYAL